LAVNVTLIRKDRALEKLCLGEPSDVISTSMLEDVRVLPFLGASVEDSVLATKFSCRWDDYLETLEKDLDGNFFIDQPKEQ